MTTLAAHLTGFHARSGQPSRRRTRVAGLLGLCGVWLVSRLGAADLPPPAVQEQPWRIASYADEARLGRRMVFGIAFTADNTVWVAASDGLHRFDGFGWEVFTTTNGLPSNFIRTVTVTRDGALWVGTDSLWATDPDLGGDAQRPDAFLKSNAGATTPPTRSG